MAVLTDIYIQICIIFHFYVALWANRNMCMCSILYLETERMTFRHSAFNKFNFDIKSVFYIMYTLFHVIVNISLMKNYQSVKDNKGTSFPTKFKKSICPKSCYTELILDGYKVITSK